MKRKLAALAIAVIVAIAALAAYQATAKAKKWDTYYESPVIVDVENSDMGGVEIRCSAWNPPSCPKTEFELECDLEQSCMISYVAKRVNAYPGGYEVLGDSVIDREIGLTQKSKDKLGNRIVIMGKDDELLVDLYESGEKILSIEGRDVCGSGSEASVSTTYLGFVKTPGAETLHFGGVSIAGSDSKKGKIVDMFKSGVTCTVTQEFLE